MDLSRENIFDPLATEMHTLFESCKKTCFIDEQAFELTKTYCSVAFINQSINLRLKEEDRIRKIMSRKHYSKSTMEETK